jgi:hypothetical protein
MPSNSYTTIYYWDAISGSIPDEFIDEIEQLKADELKSVRFETLNAGSGANAQPIHSIRTNDAGQLLFTLYEHNGKRYLHYLDYLPNHGYDRSKFLNPKILRAYLGNHAEEIIAQIEAGEVQWFDAAEAEIQDIQAAAKNVQADSAVKALHFYKNQLIQYNTTQDNIAQSSFPALVSGTAGSGKSALIQKVLQTQVDQSTAIENIYCLTQSKKLTEYMKAQWDQSPEISDENKGRVQFKTYEAFVIEQFDLNPEQQVRFEYFNTWLKLIKDKPGLPVKTIYDEFKFIAAYIREPEKYIQENKRQSLIDDESTKAKLVELFAKYTEFLNKNNKYDLNFVSLDLQDKVAFIAIDEAQDLSPVQQRNVVNFARDRQVLIATDSNQSLEESISTRPFLLNELGDHVHHKLTINYRNPICIIKIANQILKLKNYISGGVTDLDEYIAMESLESAMQGTAVMVQNREELFAKHSILNKTANPNTAVIVNSQADKAVATQKYQTPLVFTIDEIKGLEFDNIIIDNLIPGEDPFVRQINQKMPENLQEFEAKATRPKDKHDKQLLTYNPFFHKLFTAFTRVQKNVYFVNTQSHQNQKIVNGIHAALPQATVSEPVEEQSFGLRDWANSAIKLFQQEETQQQAFDIMRNKLGLDIQQSANENIALLKQYQVGSIESPQSMKKRPTNQAAEPAAIKKETPTAHPKSLPKSKPTQSAKVIKPNQVKPQYSQAASDYLARIIQADTPEKRAPLIGAVCKQPDAPKWLFEVPVLGYDSIFDWALMFPDKFFLDNLEADTVYSLKKYVTEYVYNLDIVKKPKKSEKYYYELLLNVSYTDYLGKAVENKKNFDAVCRHLEAHPELITVSLAKLIVSNGHFIQKPSTYKNISKFILSFINSGESFFVFQKADKILTLPLETFISGHEGSAGFLLSNFKVIKEKLNLIEPEMYFNDRPDSLFKIYSYFIFNSSFFMPLGPDNKDRSGLSNQSSQRLTLYKQILFQPHLFSALTKELVFDKHRIFDISPVVESTPNFFYLLAMGGELTHPVLEKMTNEHSWFLDYLSAEDLFEQREHPSSYDIPIVKKDANLLPPALFCLCSSESGIEFLRTIIMLRPELFNQPPEKFILKIHGAGNLAFLDGIKSRSPAAHELKEFFKTKMQRTDAIAQEPSFAQVSSNPNTIFSAAASKKTPEAGEKYWREILIGDKANHLN